MRWNVFKRLWRANPMTPEQHKARSVEMAGELLDEAMVKRKAVVIAKSRCDPVRVKQMEKDAAIMESAAALLDPAREAPQWKIVP